MANQQRIGLVGGGVIGAGWAARFLLEGHDVAVYDPDPEIARKLETVIDAARRPEIIIASSTSGLLPTKLQSAMTHPERFVVGHPFNPVYLLPLVEVCGGDRTSDAAKQEAIKFYSSVGMRPLHVRKEIDGFIADR